MTIQSQRRIVTFPQQSSQTISVNEVIKAFMSLVLIVLGFLAAFMFNDIVNSVRIMQKDISALQVSFSALAQHVQDEDINRK